jgi:hypothetical protein
VGNSRGARKLARTPHVNQKKKKTMVCFFKKNKITKVNYLSGSHKKCSWQGKKDLLWKICEKKK